MNLVAICLQGIITGLGLIMVIGSQNAFILRHGIQGRRVFLIATVSALGDIVLITLGVNGLGLIIQRSPLLQLITVIAASLFLLTYGACAFYDAWQGKSLAVHMPSTPIQNHRWKIILLALGFSLLNPHAWLDAAIILGSIGGQFDSAMERYSFTIGAILASIIWFYSLAYGATRLAPYLRQQRPWQLINILVGCMMWFITATLIFEYFM